MRAAVVLVSCILMADQASPPRDPAGTAAGKPGTIRGRVVNATGEPLYRVRVVVNTGGTTPPSGVTDVRGEFEIADVPAGSHTLSASRAGYLTVQYGQRRPREAGRSVEVRSADVVEGLAIALPAGAVLAGMVTDDMGDACEGVRVDARVYNVRVGDGPASASTVVSVTGAELDNVILNARTGSTVAGSFVTDAGERPPFPASGVRVSLAAAPSASVLPTVRLPGVDNDWTVQMTGVGGPFVFRVVNLPKDWMLDEVRVGDREITDVPFDVSTLGADVSDLTFVLTQQVGTIGGSVTTADGKPSSDAIVVVFSENASHWNVASRHVRSTRPTADGSFSISSLPAGSYLAVARRFLIDGEWETREFLDAARQDAARVTLTRGGSESLTLKLPSSVNP